jgi:hypothetical protein
MNFTQALASRADPEPALPVFRNAGRGAAAFRDDHPVPVVSMGELAIAPRDPKLTRGVLAHRYDRFEWQSRSRSDQLDRPGPNPVEATAERSHPDIAFPVLDEAADLLV